MMQRLGLLARILLKALRLGALLVLLCLSSLLLVLSREEGNQALLHGLAQWVDGLTIGASQGTLWQGLTLTDVRFNHDTVEVAIKKLHLQVSAYHLLRGKILVRELGSQDLQLIIQPNNEPSTPLRELPSLRLPLPIEIKKLALLNNDIHVQQTALFINSIHAELYGFNTTLRIQQLDLISADKKLYAQGALNTQQDWSLNVALDWQLDLPDAMQPYFSQHQAQGHIQFAGSVMTLQIYQKTQQPFVMQGEIRIQPFAPDLAFAIQQNWQAVEIQFEQQKLHLPAGSLQLEGDLQQYQLQVNSQIQWLQLPIINLALQAQGDLSQLLIQQATLSQQQQAFLLQGQLAWQPYLSWQLAGDLQAFDPQPFLPELQGSLGFDWRSTGQFQDSLQFTADIENLHGQLQNLPLQGGVQLDWQEQQQSLALVLNLAQHRVQFNGQQQQQQFNFSALLNSDNLTQLHPSLAGAVDSQISAQGTLQQPIITGYLRGKNLAYQAINLAQLDLRLEHQTQQSASLQLQRLQQQNKVLLDNLKLDVQGDSQNQQWQLAMQALQADLTGRWQTHSPDAQQWQLAWQTLDIEHDYFGLWRLQPSQIWQLSREQQTIPRFCLQQQNQQGELCLNAKQQQQQAEALLTLQNLNLQPFAALIDSDLQLYGWLNAELSLQKQGENIQAQANVASNNGYVQLLDGDEELIRVPWQTVGVEASLDKQNYQAHLQAVLDEQNQLQQKIQGSLADTQKINGHLQFNFNQMQFLELMTPLREVAGQIKGDLTVQGGLSQPLLQGQIHLLDGSMQIPDAGLLLENVAVTLDAQATGDVNINGKLYSGGEPLTLTGKAQQQVKLPWPVQLHIYGDNVQALNLPDLQLWVAPDIQVDLAGQTITSRGKVLVRRAQAKLRELPENAIAPSSDVVFVGDDDIAEKWLMDTDLTIDLGNQFVVEGMGLNAKFSGDVRIQDKPQQPLNLTGVVRVNEGRYKAYGQNLTIERGDILFQGSADDPGLDLVASRTLTRHNVKAGLEIGGTLKNPRSRVFAEPAMDETEAMSWLLFGKPLSSASESDGNAILQAIAVYGIEQGDFITHKLSDSLGLDIGFDTDGETDQAAFTVGKQLSSRLYLRYSVALFESLSSVMLRYQLNPYLNLETRSSAEMNSIDLLFRKER